MSNFPIIATVLSMVLGLSVTRLLLGLVTVFRIRRTSPIDWVPLVWALVLFVTQLEYWWSINQLPTIKPTYSFPEFAFLVLLTLMLFLSTALLLPSRSEDEQEGLQSYFEKDGRFGLLAFAAFLTLAFVVNVFFLNNPIASEWAYIDVVMIVVPIATFVIRSRRVYAALTLLYLPFAMFDTAISLTS